MTDVCDVCGTHSSNCTHDDSKIICDECVEEFEGVTFANDIAAEFDDVEEPSND